MSPPFGVLVVCTGNICRSPAVEAQLAAGLPGADVEIASAGLHACTGEPMDPRMARQLDVPLPPGPARQLLAPMVAGAELVLTMTRDQRRAVVTLVPAAVRRTFTLREFADLADLAVLACDGGALPAGGSPGGLLAAVVSAAPRLRHLRPAGAPDDVEDPYGRDDAVVVRVAGELREAVDRVLSVIGTDVAAPCASGRGTADRVNSP